MNLLGAVNARKHVSTSRSDLFFHLRRRRLHLVRRQLSRDVCTIGLSCCAARLDYCNAVLAGLPAATLSPLQSLERYSETHDRPETT